MAVPTDGSTYYVEIWVNAAGVNADAAKAVVTYDPALLDVTQVITPKIEPADLEIVIEKGGAADLEHVAVLRPEIVAVER